MNAQIVTDAQKRQMVAFSWLFRPIPGSIIIGNIVYIITIVFMNVTFALMSETLTITSYISAFVCTYGIGCPVSYYCLRQNEMLVEVFNELEEVHSLLEERSQRDFMTGLFNRETFIQKTNDAFSAGIPTAMLIADIDNFKFVNDTWGHLAGDQAIELVASRLVSELGQDCPIGRIGGEEFAILLTGDMTSKASKIAERLRESVEALEFFPSSGMRQPLTISIGGARAGNGSVVTDLIRNADRCLYQAKKSGRNRTEFDRAA